MTARQFSVLYGLVAQICQDESSNGKANAKVAINTIIKELTREFELPQMMKGQDQSVYVTPIVGVGPQFLTLATDIIRLENVFWVDNSSQIFQLEEIESDEEWLSTIDENSDGDPLVYRDFETDSAGNHKIQIWPSPGAGWVSKSGGKLYYTYWAQLAQLSGDSDVPNLPYELDTILVNGGVLEMARMQGDTALIGLYSGKYEDDKGEIRAWILRQHEKDVQMGPDEPMGTFGQAGGFRGYK
jgi:hypothetical protein